MITKYFLYLLPTRQCLSCEDCTAVIVSYSDNTKTASIRHAVFCLQSFNQFVNQ